MGVLDDAIREHLELKRRHGSDPVEVSRLEREALGPVTAAELEIGGESEEDWVDDEPQAPGDDYTSDPDAPTMLEQPPTEAYQLPIDQTAPPAPVFADTPPPVPPPAVGSATGAPSAPPPPPSFSVPPPAPAGAVPPPPPVTGATPPPPAARFQDELDDEFDFGAEVEEPTPAPTSAVPPPPPASVTPPAAGPAVPPAPPVSAVPPPPPAATAPPVGPPAPPASAVPPASVAPPAPPASAATPPPVQAPPTAPPAPAPAPAPRVSDAPPAPTVPPVPRRRIGGDTTQGQGETTSDPLADTPEFLEETPDHDRLWFEQKPPRDFDF